MKTITSSQILDVHAQTNGSGYAGNYGCFEKNGKAFWGRGGDASQNSALMDGQKMRIYCPATDLAEEESYLPASGAGSARSRTGCLALSALGAAMWAAVL